jgi:hypothetical protein
MPLSNSNRAIAEPDDPAGISTIISGLPSKESIFSKSGATLGPDRAMKTAPIRANDMAITRKRNFTFFFQSREQNPE